MIVDRRQSRWAVGTGVAAAVSLGVYVVYATLSPNGARGGSLMGLFFAALGTGVIVFECLLGLRKRYPASPLGRVKTWVSAHVWLGLLSFLLILMHSGFRWGNGLAGVLMWLFAVILVSGIFGVALQNYIPRRMTELVPHETIYEQIPTVIRGLRTEADERVEFVTADLGIVEEDPELVRAGGVKQYFDPAQKKSAAEKVQAVVEKRKASPQIEIEESARDALRAHYLQEIRPYLTDSPAPLSRRLLGTPRTGGRLFQSPAHHHAGGRARCAARSGRDLRRAPPVAGAAPLASVAAHLAAGPRAALLRVSGVDRGARRAVAEILTWPKKTSRSSTSEDCAIPKVSRNGSIWTT